MPSLSLLVAPAHPWAPLLLQAEGHLSRTSAMQLIILQPVYTKTSASSAAPEGRGNPSAILRVISILNKVSPPPTSRNAQPLVEQGMASTRATNSPNRHPEQCRYYWGYTKVANEGRALGEFTFRELSKSNRLKWDNINHSKSVWLRLWAEELREF